MEVGMAALSTVPALSRSAILQRIYKWSGAGFVRCKFGTPVARKPVLLLRLIRIDVE
jgi:hypothetical protein